MPSSESHSSNPIHETPSRTSDYSLVRKPTGAWLLHVPASQAHPIAAALLVDDDGLTLIRDHEQMRLLDVDRNVIERLCADHHRRGDDVLVSEIGRDGDPVRDYPAPVGIGRGEAV